MTVKEIQSLVDSYNYWDTRVTKLNCDYFADEIELVYNDEDLNIIYKFSGCYKSFFDHVKIYDKICPVSNMKTGQIPYFLQNITIGEKSEQGIDFYTCKIEMFPLEVEIWCKDIKIISEKVESK